MSDLGLLLKTYTPLIQRAPWDTFTPFLAFVRLFVFDEPRGRFGRVKRLKRTLQTRLIAIVRPLLFQWRRGHRAWGCSNRQAFSKEETIVLKTFCTRNTFLSKVSTSSAWKCAIVTLIFGNFYGDRLRRLCPDATSLTLLRFAWNLRTCSSRDIFHSPSPNRPMSIARHP